VNDTPDTLAANLLQTVFFLAGIALAIAALRIP
jgi:hypothetical protein